MDGSKYGAGSETPDRDLSALETTTSVINHGIIFLQPSFSIATLANPYYFLEDNFWWSPGLIGLFILTIFIGVFLRYLLLASAYQWWTKKFRQEKKYVLDNRQFLREVKFKV